MFKGWRRSSVGEHWRKQGSLAGSLSSPPRCQCLRRARQLFCWWYCSVVSDRWSCEVAQLHSLAQCASLSFRLVYHFFFLVWVRHWPYCQGSLALPSTPGRLRPQADTAIGSLAWLSSLSSGQQLVVIRVFYFFFLIYVIRRVQIIELEQLDIGVLMKRSAFS